MPDYEIRLFQPKVKLATIHIAHYPSDDEALEEAQRLADGHAHFELRSGRQLIATSERDL